MVLGANEQVSEVQLNKPASERTGLKGEERNQIRLWFELIHTFEEVIKEIAYLRNEFLRAKKLNIDLSELMKDIEYPRSLLEQGEYDNAMRTVRTTEMKLKRTIDSRLIEHGD